MLYDLFHPEMDPQEFVEAIDAATQNYPLLNESAEYVQWLVRDPEPGAVLFLQFKLNDEEQAEFKYVFTGSVWKQQDQTPPPTESQAKFEPVEAALPSPIYRQLLLSSAKRALQFGSVVDIVSMYNQLEKFGLEGMFDWIDIVDARYREGEFTDEERAFVAHNIPI